jgi:hypothetical protein
MVRASAREIKDYNLGLSLPFYRFKITESGKSDQHELLLALDETDSLVFYAAPRFHELNEINDAWNSNRVAERSIFVKPQLIGALDDDSHHVSYDGLRAWLCSDPVQINVLSAPQLIEQIQSRLHDDPRPLGAKLPEMVEQVEAAKRRGSERIERRGRQRFEQVPVAVPKPVQRTTLDAQPPSEIPVRVPRTLSDSERVLRRLSDDAAKIFNAQLVIVQPREPSR